MPFAICRHIYKRNNMPSITSYRDIEIPKCRSILQLECFITQQINPSLIMDKLQKNTLHASSILRNNFEVLILILYTTSVGQLVILKFPIFSFYRLLLTVSGTCRSARFFFSGSVTGYSTKQYQNKSVGYQGQSSIISNIQEISTDSTP